MGLQSAGKSTVISRLTNIRLPSKDGLSTRAPLHIASRLTTDDQLNLAELSVQQHDVISSETNALRASGWHLKDMRYVKSLLQPGQAWPPEDDMVVAAVEEATAALAGRGKNITSKQVMLRWESTTTPNLDVIDLPGIIISAVGDQPDSLPQDIKKIVREYISDPATIILCIHAAPNDTATAPMKLVMDFDPNLERSVVVLTKVDQIMVDGNASRAANIEAQRTKLKQHLEELSSKKKPLDIVLVKNSGMPGTSLHDQLAEEEETLSIFRDLQHAGRKPKLGMEALVDRLSEVLISRSQEELPGLKAHLRAAVNKIKAELQDIPTVASPVEAMRLADGLMEQLKDALRHVANRDFDKLRPYDSEKRERAEEDRIYKNLQDVHGRYFNQVIVVPPFMDDAYWNKLIMEQMEHEGGMLPEHVPIQVQRRIFREEFGNKVVEALDSMAEEACTVVWRTFEALVELVFKSYRRLGDEVKQRLREKVVKVQLHLLKQYLKSTAEAQTCGDLYTLSPMYATAMEFYERSITQTDKSYDRELRGCLGMEDALFKAPHKENEPPLPNKPEQPVGSVLDAHRAEDKADHRVLSISTLRQQQWGSLVYCTIVHASLMDMLPRVVRMFLIHQVVDRRVADMVADWRLEPGWDEWLHNMIVDPEVKVLRDSKQQQLDALQAALDRLAAIGSPRDGDKPDRNK
ncbi:hypothetical protein HYH02_012585 [Chlamydomonas schloesseri]|uniref:Dynamin-type G domain-containing protein n=1 Tax=Chlamydomonas schloesseri TaxID=2026947 RepID=A0A835W2B6_9CHLO|nr:hypothetical protein HYH02_012585 [Chlamydomonas schloesseri]|eukprot:KAG2433466.1 hypothetical protein HYH02_012585 [Chlamydomonas schloesseri]